MKVTLKMCLYQSIYYNYWKYAKIFRKRFIIGSVIDHTISISKYNLLAGGSYVKLPKQLDHPRKGLINVQNIDDNKCFRWCLVRCLNPADYNPRRIRKAHKKFAVKLDFKNIKFPVETRDIHKIEKALVFLAIKIRKSIQFMYQKNALKKNMLIYCW